LRVGVFTNRGLVERHLAGCWEGVRGFGEGGFWEDERRIETFRKIYRGDENLTGSVIKDKKNHLMFLKWGIMRLETRTRTRNPWKGFPRRGSRRITYHDAKLSSFDAGILTVSSENTNLPSSFPINPFYNL